MKKGSWKWGIIGTIFFYLLEVLYLFVGSNLINFGNVSNLLSIVLDTFTTSYLILTLIVLLIGFLIGYILNIILIKITKKNEE